MKIAIISDIHEDLVSLKQAIKQIHKLKCDEIVCLGDIVGFQPEFYPYSDTKNASECLSIVKLNCSVIIPGNHDLFPIKKIPKISGRFDFPENWYKLKPEERIKLSKGKIWQYDKMDLPTNLKENDLDFISELPEFVIKEFAGINFMFTHFLYPDISGVSMFHLKKSKETREHFEFMDTNNCQIGFSGHFHIPGTMLATKSRLKYKRFGTYKLKRKTQWIVSPCIANSTGKNGFLVFETNSFELDVISL